MKKLAPQLLTADRFRFYGDVIETNGVVPVSINQGNCQRFHDVADLNFDRTGVAGISLFVAKPYTSPYRLTYVERHPLGSQAFLPMTPDPFLVIVASDEQGKAQEPQAFITDGKQGVNYSRGVWHGVLAPINNATSTGSTTQFAVIDYIGTENNLEEYIFDVPYLVNF